MLKWDYSCLLVAREPSNKIVALNQINQSINFMEQFQTVLV